MKKDSRTRLFEVMQRVAPNFNGKALNENFNNDDDPLEGNSGSLILDNGDKLDVIFSNVKNSDANSKLITFGSNNPFRNFSARLSQMQFNELLNGGEVDTQDGTLTMKNSGAQQNKFGQQLRNPSEFDKDSEGYTPFGDEGIDESPKFGGQNVSQDQHDELQYDKSTMEKAMGDAFKTPEGYQMRNPVKPGDTVKSKDGDSIKIAGINPTTGDIAVRVYPADEEMKKYFPKGYFDITWSQVQFDTIVG